jgi:hypothetical protein
MEPVCDPLTIDHGPWTMDHGPWIKVRLRAGVRRLKCGRMQWHSPLAWGFPLEERRETNQRAGLEGVTRRSGEATKALGDLCDRSMICQSDVGLLAAAAQAQF